MTFVRPFRPAAPPTETAAADGEPNGPISGTRERHACPPHGEASGAPRPPGPPAMSPETRRRDAATSVRAARQPAPGRCTALPVARSPRVRLKEV